MNNIKSHAQREIEILENTVPDAIIAPFKKEIIALCEAFGESGQSGGSAPFTAKAISRAVENLMMFEVIAPLTGEDDEWMDVSDINEGATNVMKYQNIRDSRVFKQADGRAYFIDAIVFNGSISGGFTGNGIHSDKHGEIGSLQYIKSFPFKPKIFYVDVLDYRWNDKGEFDDDGDWWTHVVANDDQLEEVFEYYDKK